MPPSWRIFYADGSTYSDEDGPVENAPGAGVEVVLQRSRAAGVERLYYKHFYVWSERYACWLPIGDQRAPGIRCEERLVERGWTPPGRDRVHPDVGGCELDRERSGQMLDRRSRGG